MDVDGGGLGKVVILADSVFGRKLVWQKVFSGSGWSWQRSSVVVEEGASNRGWL